MTDAEDRGWGPVAYAGAHKRTRRIRGNARLHACDSCGGQARTWALAHGTPEARLLMEDGLPYSLSPWDYIALCDSCHGLYDGHATLTPDLVRSLRLRHAAGEGYRALAREHGVDHKTVRKAVLRKSWAWVA